MAELEKDKIEAYVEEDGGRCPWCMDGDIDPVSEEMHGASAYQEMECFSCQARWTAVYSLSSLTAFEPGEAEKEANHG